MTKEDSLLVALDDMGSSIIQIQDSLRKLQDSLCDIINLSRLIKEKSVEKQRLDRSNYQGGW